MAVLLKCANLLSTTSTRWLKCKAMTEMRQVTHCFCCFQHYASCSDHVMMSCSDHVMMSCSDRVMMSCSDHVMMSCSDHVMMSCSVTWNNTDDWVTHFVTFWHTINTLQMAVNAHAWKSCVNDRLELQSVGLLVSRLSVIHNVTCCCWHLGNIWTAHQTYLHVTVVTSRHYYSVPSSLTMILHTSLFIYSFDTRIIFVFPVKLYWYFSRFFCVIVCSILWN